MTEKLTIHIHSVHYLQSGLPLMEYVLLLCYEQKRHWSVSDLQTILKVSNRTVDRMRSDLVHWGYLEKGVANGVYSLTNKLYPSEKKVLAPAV